MAPLPRRSEGKLSRRGGCSDQAASYYFSPQSSLPPSSSNRPKKNHNLVGITHPNPCLLSATVSHLGRDCGQVPRGYVQYKIRRPGRRCSHSTTLSLIGYISCGRYLVWRKKIQRRPPGRTWKHKYKPQAAHSLWKGGRSPSSVDFWPRKLPPL